MYKILKNKKIAPGFFKIRIKAPLISQKAKPGEFVILRIHKKGERIPLTLFNWDKQDEIIELVYQVVGKTTRELSNFKKDKNIENILGPLGNPSKISQNKKIVCIAGGAGIAMIFPLIKALKKKANRVISILGARNSQLLILRREIEKLSDEVLFTTDDGSFGRKGLVTEELKILLEEQVNIDEVFAVGPAIMMRAVTELTCPEGIKTTVSLNSIMMDGTGMCGSCRVTVGGEVKFTCVDGPEFDGCKVDFDELEKRNKRFQEKEEEAVQHYCRLKDIDE